VTERSREPKSAGLAGLIDKNANFSIKTAEPRDERASRLRREEAESAHQRRIALIVHIFVMTVVAVAFLVCSYMALAKDPKSGLPDKALAIITAIVAAAVGYLTGKNSK
jgi:hypothetical protein